MYWLRRKTSKWLVARVWRLPQGQEHSPIALTGNYRQTKSYARLSYLVILHRRDAYYCTGQSIMQTYLLILYSFSIACLSRSCCHLLQRLMRMQAKVPVQCKVTLWPGQGLTHFRQRKRCIPQYLYSLPRQKALARKTAVETKLKCQKCY